MQFTFHRIWRGIALVFTVSLVTSCVSSIPNAQKSTSTSANPVAAANAPKVVATTTILCDMVREIAQNTVNLTCLLKPGVDGHVYQPVPEDRRAIEDAKLILYSGYDFEPGLIKFIQSTSNPAPKVAVAEKAVPKPLMGHEHGEKHGNEKAAEHNHDHVEGSDTPDPHVWQNAENGAKMAEVIQAELTKLIPENKQLYIKNGEVLETQLNAIHRWIKSQIATVPAANRKLVTTHDAMQYFSEAYNIPVEGALQGLNTQEKPTATRVKELVDEVKAAGVPTIFAEVVVNSKLIEAVARDAKVKVADGEIYSDSLGEAGSEGDTYPKMLIANTRTIVEGLNGTYVAFQPK
ncbi:MAG: zinc ABC transporter substrate-binding protein [Oscillatoriales cyanobacterium C42_A2020_001]|nr:zinc ABC transporter substrate-binding protein [Leptolyngbyaceae cyanobacterium C42_A2020_001]